MKIEKALKILQKDCMNNAIRRKSWQKGRMTNGITRFITVGMEFHVFFINDSRILIDIKDFPENDWEVVRVEEINV